jgi:hypothetical protein
VGAEAAGEQAVAVEMWTTSPGRPPPARIERATTSDHMLMSFAV